MIIRRATANDADAVLGCLRAAFAPYEKDYTPAAYVDTVQQRVETMTVFVADAGTIIGTIACNGEGHLRGMAVLPEHQGSGIAGMLLEAAENELRAKGCSEVTLDTTEPLQRAVRFYEKHGYRASGRVSNFFGMPLHEYVKPL